MDDADRSNGPAGVRELRSYLPYASMMAILWGVGTAFRPGPIPFLSGPLPLVVGLVLAIAFFVVVVSQFRTRPWIQTAQSAFVAVLLVVAAEWDEMCRSFLPAMLVTERSLNGISSSVVGAATIRGWFPRLQ